jgi:Arc/MetJ-type ribon-helix-helix transcriptional regulator
MVDKRRKNFDNKLDFRVDEDTKAFLDLFREKRKFKNTSELIREIILAVKHLESIGIDLIDFSTMKRLEELKEKNLI